MGSALQFLLEQSVQQVKEREHAAIEDLLDARGHRVVIFGAGTLGRRALPLLNALGAHPLAFCDNNAAVWSTQVEGVPVLSPEEAAFLYGESALFLVAVWNDRHWFKDTHRQLTKLGCTSISTYAPLFWRFPDTFLQLVLLNAPPHQVYSRANEVMRAETIWADPQSLRTYRANIRWRALGDALDLPGRPDENTYFPDELFRLREDEAILDCGAFDGDTIRQALEVTGGFVGRVHAVEADSISFARLQRFVKELPPQMQERICLYSCAVGNQRGVIHFENTGTVDSKISDQGSVVEVFPIDELFQDKELTFVKMDIEGAEFDALSGGAKVIQRDQPILAICLYHTQSDIWRIPLMLHEMLPAHHFYLRGYEGDGFQTVLFAVPPQRVISTSS
jgi:FkbM family methyltransferase